MLSTNKVVHAEDTFCDRDCVSSVKITTNVCNRGPVIGLILLPVLKTTKYTRLYPATHYYIRLQEVKKRIASESVGIF